MAAFEGIESGEECERLAPIVEALATGAATSRQIVAIRPHLRHCSACRAAVRDLHLSRLHRASLWWPGFLLAAGAPELDSRLFHILAENGPTSAPLGPAPAGLKHRVLDLFHRTQASDVATGVQIAASGGGGRLATVAAILGLCLTGAGVGSVCVVTGVISNPFALIGDKPPQLAKPHEPHHRARAQPTPSANAPRLVSTIAVATSRVQSASHHRAAKSKRKPSAARDPSQGTAPASHENAPISPAPASSSGQDSFTPEAPQAPTPPAPAPATGGDEFTP
jgi:hypothetical protein